MLSRAALLQVHAVDVPPPEVHVPEPLEDAAAIEDGCSPPRRRAARARCVVPRRRRRAACWTGRRATPAWPTIAEPGDAAGVEMPSRRLRARAGLPATPAADRRLRHLRRSQAARRSPSMVVCANGRMRRASTRSFGIRPVGRALPDGVHRQARADGTGREPGRGRRILDDFHIDAPGRAPALSSPSRRRRADAGPDRDRRRQGPARGGLRRAAEARPRRPVAVGLAKQEELVFTRDQADAIALPPGSPPRCGCCSASATGAPFAVTYHRPGPGSARRSALGAGRVIDGVGSRQCRNTLLVGGAPGSVSRRAAAPPREELPGSSGPRPPNAILAAATFARSACGRRLANDAAGTCKLRRACVGSHDQGRFRARPYQCARGRPVDRGGGCPGEPSKVEARQEVIETLGEGRSLASWASHHPESVAHIARMVADASRRAHRLGGDVRLGGALPG